jgi:hypothetical protein
MPVPRTDGIALTATNSKRHLVIDGDLHARLKAVCKKQKTSMRSVSESLLIEFVNEAEKTPAQADTDVAQAQAQPAQEKREET